MLTDTQRSLIFVAVPNSYTVSGVVFTPAIMYENQFVGASYPTITLEYTPYSIDASMPLDLVRNITSDADNVTYHRGGFMFDSLSVNVYAQDYDGPPFINGIVISQSIANDLFNWFRYTFNGTTTFAKKFGCFSISSIRSLDALEVTNFRRRRQFDARIVHSYDTPTTVERIKTVNVEEVVIP